MVSHSSESPNIAVYSQRERRKIKGLGGGQGGVVMEEAEVKNNYMLLLTMI